MATNKLYPAYVQIAYTSAFGNHVMTLPIRALIDPVIGTAPDTTAWTTTVIDVEGMVDSMIGVLKAAVPNTITFNQWTVFHVPGVGQPGQPVFTKAVASGAGTETGLTGQSKAVQVTLTFRSTAFGISRLVVLDRPVNGNFGSFIDPTGDFVNVISEITSTGNAWAARDDARPSQYTNTSITLNKRLRRKYGMI